MTKEKFLTKKWNNILTAGLGIPTLVYAVIVLKTNVMSDFVGWLGMVLIGAAY